MRALPVFLVAIVGTPAFASANAEIPAETRSTGQLLQATKEAYRDHASTVSATIEHLGRWNKALDIAGSLDVRTYAHQTYDRTVNSGGFLGFGESHRAVYKTVTSTSGGASPDGINEFLATLPDSVTGGYRVAAGASGADVSQMLVKLRAKDRELARATILGSATKIRTLEHALGQRFGTNRARAQRDLTAFLASAPLDQVADLAARTQGELSSLLTAGTHRRVPILRASSDVKYSKNQQQSASGNKLSLGVTFKPLGLDLATSDDRSMSATQEQFSQTTRIEQDQLLPGAMDFQVPIRAAVLSRLTGDEAPEDVREYVAYMSSPTVLTPFEGRVLMDKALTLGALVDYLATHGGGKHLTPALRKWMQTRLTFRGPAKEAFAPEELGQVVLASATRDVAALERTTARRGYSITSRSQRRALTSQGANAFVSAMDRPIGLTETAPATRDPSRRASSRRATGGTARR